LTIDKIERLNSLIATAIHNFKANKGTGPPFLCKTFSQRFCCTLESLSKVLCVVAGCDVEASHVVVVDTSVSLCPAAS
jgi:hypothetical protein